MSRLTHALSVDIGGTKLAVGRVTRSGQLLDRYQRPTVQTTSGTELFTSLADLMKMLVDARPGVDGGAVNSDHPFAGFAVCGVGVGGPMTPGGTTVSPLNIEPWDAFPLLAELESLTGLRVVIDNDAKALALGEGWFGAARGRSSFLGMVVSTGVGGGLIVDGRLLHGASANAGHIGHLQVVQNGRLCRCGSRGCLEAEASGPAIEAITGAPASVADDAIRVRTGTLVGRAVASVATLLDIDLAVVAGSVALGFGELFFEAAQEELDRRTTIRYSRGAKIVPAQLGHDAPLIGAAALGFAQLGDLPA